MVLEFSDNSMVGCFDYHPETDSVELSDEACRLIGIDADQTPESMSAFLSCFEGDSKALIKRYLSPSSKPAEMAMLDCRTTKAGTAGGTVRICLMPMQYNAAETRIIGLVFGASENDMSGIQEVVDQNKARKYFNMANVILLSLTNKGMVEAINEKGCEVLNFGKEDIIGKNWVRSFVPKTQRKDVKAILDKIIAAESGGTEFYINSIVNSRGEERIISWRNSYLKDTNGKLLSVLSAGSDISDKIEAEQALKESEEKFRYVFENSCIGNSLTLPSGEIAVNHAFCEMLGYTADELKGMKWQDITHPDDIVYCEMQLKKLSKEKLGFISFDKRYIKKNGDILWANVHTNKRIDSRKKLLYYMTSVIDITVQKDTEAELKKSEERYQLLFSEMKDGFALHEIICDENGQPIDYRFLDVNPAFEYMTGLARQDVMGKTVLEVLPETESYWIEQYGYVALTGKEIRFDNYSAVLNKYFEVNAYQPAPMQFACTFKDVTQERLAKEKLIKSEKRLIAAQALAQVGNWELDFKTNTIWASEEAARMCEIEALTSRVPFPRIQRLLLPEYREVLKNAHLDLLSGRNEYDIKFKIRTERTGTIKYIHSKAIFKMDENGQNARFEGVIQDITKQKMLEDDLVFLSFHDQLTGLYNRRYFEDKLKEMDTKENLPISIIMGDLNGLKIVNDSLGHVVGDRFLVAAADVIQKGCSGSDVAVRYGGDEFAILLANTDEKKAAKVIAAIQDSASKTKPANIELSISFGYATKTKSGEALSEILVSAENQMYRRKFDSRSNMHSKTIKIIMNTLFEKSPRESEHSKRVSKLCAALAREMEFSKDDVDRIRIAGLVHDIGKISIEERILNKKEPLTNEEWNAVRNHADSGWRILSSSTDFSEIATVIRAHHERWDGKGYPCGLKAEEIPLEARMISVADSFDAMTSDRPYHNKLSQKQAVSELKRCAGAQFDPQVVDIFINKVLS